MSNIPENYVEIEVEIDENGNFTRKIVGHGPNTSCKMEKDDEIMNDLLAELGEVSDCAHTDEYYAEKSNPIIARPLKTKMPNIQKEDGNNKLTTDF